MQHQQYTDYVRKEIGFLKLLVARIHEQDSLSVVELDLALAKTQGIYEQLLKLKLVHQQLASKTMPTMPPIEAVAPEPVSEPIQTPEPAPIQTPEPAPVQPPAPAPAPVQPPAPAPAPKPVATSTSKTEPVTLADKIRPTAAYNPINEMLAQKNKTDLAGKLQTKPLSRMADGIGVNDRFQYVRELFAGDSALYSETLQCIDAAESLNAALSVVAPFAWDADDATAQQFIALIHRKHPQ